MKILIVGNGGREHALAWKARADIPDATIFAAPGNPGIAEIGKCIPISADDIVALADFAKQEKIDLTIVGPEAPLAAGIVDAFQKEQLPIFGPTAKAARIETSKRYAKELMSRMGVPTARATHHRDAASAKVSAREMGAPVVIKASGLAAGKGVIIAQTIAEADSAIDSIIEDRRFGSAGDEILVEEFMTGEELSIFAICDGENALMMLGAQDHKRLLDGDEGPNTGGMGAYAPVSTDTHDVRSRVHSEIFLPVLRGLAEDGNPFCGLLYAGLMLTESGPKVVEFNCRFGDPETQALLPLLQSSLIQPMLAVATGRKLVAEGSTFELTWKPEAAVTTVLASGGYPDSTLKGQKIDIPELTGNVLVFHAGTARDHKAAYSAATEGGVRMEGDMAAGNMAEGDLTAGDLITAGGRVLAVTGIGSTLQEAAATSLSFSEKISFNGK